MLLKYINRYIKVGKPLLFPHSFLFPQTVVTFFSLTGGTPVIFCYGVGNRPPIYLGDKNALQ